MRCKMVLNKVALTTWGHELSFSAVTDGTQEDKEFWKYTPSGTVELRVLNDKIVEGLKIGTKYYVDFTEVDSQK